MPQWLRAGIVGRPHGLDGSFHVVQASAALLAAGALVRVGESDRRIERRAGTEDRVILRLEGCGDRNAADALRGSELLVTREAAPALEEDEWWAEDLEGCEVFDGERAVGTVRRLLALPSCEVLEVECPGAELLVPLVRDAVRAVDLERRAIDVDLRFLGVE
ncbi:MAG TPA: ribosome maturation factor RimM [Solirubrobacteraceae bacterium]|nr:ribosome maturation factor RimM [Solirubrobacteraceae bacterium]